MINISAFRENLVTEDCTSGMGANKSQKRVQPQPYDILEVKKGLIQPV